MPRDMICKWVESILGLVSLYIFIFLSKNNNHKNTNMMQEII